MTVRSVDFLPEIFQTDANKQFLAATLDQLVQEPRFKTTQGFIGRTVGFGVNPNDYYVVEPTADRANYQLEPGVVSLKPDTTVINDVITYPGINDAVSYNGGNGARPDRLYSSEYYTWDPFIDFDSFINFSQYYWLPDGPPVVTVKASAVPTIANYVVTRQNGVYNFSDVNGNNPTIELVRGGNYTFQVAQNTKETINYRVRNQGTSAFNIDGTNNPTLTLVRGNTYVFNLNSNGVFPFWIKTLPITGTGNAYNSGVSRNGSSTGLVTFVVPQDTPDVLYYIDENQVSMQGVLNIVDGEPGTGPGFWIQAAPGISGKLPTYPNISSRDVFGVSNNGEDLGIITFNVPYKDAQSFYYNLQDAGTVDLITDLKFNQINNVSVERFLAQYDGIDGTRNLDGRTLIFTNTAVGDDSGWVRESLFDPLQPGQNGLNGSYDSIPYSFTQDITPEERYQVWQINYVTYNNIPYIDLKLVKTISSLEKITIAYGEQWSNTQWYKNQVGTFEKIPLLTAAQDILYYQDGTDPEIFGRIKLIDQADTDTIFVNDILGKTNYTSPNGVVFTNGLKVKFTGSVDPVSYKSGVFSFNYVQTDSNTNYITGQDPVDLYVGQEIIFSSPTLGGIEPGKSYYVSTISVDNFSFTVSDTVGGDPISLQNGTGLAKANSIADRQYYVSGVGTSIKLLPVENFEVLENYSQGIDYLTIDRASQDLNPWTRSNRWFHIDVINAAAEYNNTTAVLDNNDRAKRPIIQFRPNIRLWNFGTEGKSPVDIIDFVETDAFSNIEGATEYSVDGYTFVEGTRVVFANDIDNNVRNKIYVVSFIVPDTVNPLIAQPIIKLTLANDGDVLLDQNTVVLNGLSSAGKTYWYNGSQWLLAQQKTDVQQAPLYNVYDAQNVSFGDRTKYQSSTFTGSKLFSYAVGDTGILDPILQFPLQYLNINNIGDIVFENNLYSDTFVYVIDNVSTTENVSNGFVREYSSRTAYSKELGWQTAAVESQLYQQFKFKYQYNTPLQIDVPVKQQNKISVPVLKIYVNSKFLDSSSYTYSIVENNTIINLNEIYVENDIIEVLALSDQTSRVGFYQVPINLESNPLNANSSQFTLGTIRTHYQSICENLTTLVGPAAGANNTRDLGNIVPYGLVILQQSSPLTLTGYFMRSKDYNIFDSLVYNSREYIKYKAQLLDAVIQQDIQFRTVAQTLDLAIQDVTLGKVETQPFYWSDMLPSGITFASNTYTINFVTTNTFDTVQVYNYDSSNYLGMNVYLNDVILTRGKDYIVATDGPRITLTVDLAVGDKVTINEYNATYGSFIPNTPSKLGLYPAWIPEVVTVKTSTGDVQGVRGHDGSFTPLFGDIRDDVLLEFETRIYNNIKFDENPVPLTMFDVLPGQFRDTGFSFNEINAILGNDFLSYCGWNKLDYKSQQYQASNEFTYNYSSAKNKINNQNLLGAWRGINRYFYDTEQPSLTPWEMLGFSKKPTWWENTYGPAPYTQDNLVLWDDLEAGLVKDPVAPYYLPKFARPGLTTVIPTGTEGELLSPLNSVVSTYEVTQFQKSWALGDGGPVEASWWNSSGYPFAAMHVLAVTKPAKFFSLFADRDLYKFNTEYNQYLYNNRYRLNANNLEIYGNGVSKASYINWIVDYNRVSGVNSTEDLSASLSNLDVRLCYRMASFSDKKYIQLYTEKSSPNSTNTALLIPDESYDIVLYKNQPFDRSVYSSVAIQKTDSGGYAVFGFSTTQPYFNILQSSSAGKLQSYSASGVTIRVPTQYSTTVVQVPYGFVFDNITSVANFLLSYGKFLETQGFTFTNVANGYILDWSRMVQEFIYWSQQGWSTDAIINLNPLAAGVVIERAQAVVDSLKTQTAENSVLTENGQQYPTRNLNIVRLGNYFKVEPLSTQTISYVDINFTTFEHMIVLNNQSVFGDLIYDPTTGARQSRLNIKAITSTDWNGSVNAPGFILNRDNVEEWTGLRRYSKGEIVKYKNVYWSALTIVQPSDKFNFNDWVQSDYNQIALGLLPNISNKADQLANSYNINVANIESDNDLLSYGLIGFRPRQYMSALNLDDVSQLNVYREFLDNKGTILAAELFKGKNLGKEVAEYDIYENWAVQRSVYGANANRSYVELRLNRALLSSNPSLVQVIQPTQESQANQTILFSDIWRQSYKLTSTDYLPTSTEVSTDTALPTAGYVNIDDVDLTVFNITDTSSLDQNFDKIEAGSSIWIAKVNDYDWDIDRVNSVPGAILHVCDNLNGTSRVIFSQDHNLVAGQLLIIKQFDSEVDGVYQVLSVQDVNTVNIAFQFAGDRTVADGQGLGFTLQTMRVAQPSDVVNLPYSNDLLPGARVWVDKNAAGRWSVIEKQSVFSNNGELSPLTADATEQFGKSVAQSRNQLAKFIGSPRLGVSTTGQETGGIYVYVKTSTNQYLPVSPLGPDTDSILSLTVDGVRNYGASVDFGNITWAVAGAPRSLGASGEIDVGYAAVIYKDPQLGQAGVIPYAQWQLIVPESAIDRTLPGEFGYSTVMSLDERWMYIGAPGINKVYAYGKVDYQNQYVRARGDGSTSRYYINDTIQIDSATQLKVSVDGTVLTNNVDYVVSLDYSYVEFTTAPAVGLLVDIQRSYIVQLDAGTYYDVQQSSTSGSGVGAKFTITRVRNEVGQPGATRGNVGYTDPGSGYAIGDTITISSSSFGGTADITLTVDSVTVGGGISSVSIAYSPVGLQSVFSLNEYLYTAQNIYSFSITLDGALLRPYIDYSFNDVTKDLTFINIPPAGSILVANSQEYFEYVDTLTVPGLNAAARFGHSVSCSTDGRQVLIGTPNQTVDGNSEAGKVYVFDRNVQRFIYGESDSTVDFTLPGNVTGPVSVIVNNEFLADQSNTVANAPNSFIWNGANTVTINSDLQIGDIIEIETNQFSLVEEIEQNEIAEFSNFGYAVDLCSYNCSLYVGEPNSSKQIYKGGVVERSVNQSRIYGSTKSLNAYASLTTGDTIRVNNQDVAVPGVWNSIVLYNKNQVVYNTSGSITTIYQALQSVPALTSLSNTSYWRAVDATANTAAILIKGLAAQINAEVPNVVAEVTAQGILNISTKNVESADPFNKLQVLPGSLGTAFDDLGFDTYVWIQTIESPYPTAFAGFGSSVSVDSNAVNLVVGAPNGTQYIITLFDNGSTIFDIGSTTFYSSIVNSGSVYTYNYLPSNNESVLNPGMFVFGEQITNVNVSSLDKFGTAVSYVDGVLVVGAPSLVTNDEFAPYTGSVYFYENPTQSLSWITIAEQQPTVDVRLLNSVFLYDKITGAKTEFLDFINPIQGKILGAAKQNIDYIGAVDPASYNIGPLNIRGTTWSDLNLGEVWWDTTNARFLDPNQDDINYASRQWSRLFPGSSVDVYQWVVSPTPPASYTGEGTPKDTLSYTIKSQVTDDGTIVTKYYFWVKGITTTATKLGKTLPISTVANYIGDPKASGIPYLAAINGSTIALYNCGDLINAQDTIISIEFDRELTNNEVHVEYELIPQDREDGFLSSNLYRKLLDSFCGTDEVGNLVPDPNLTLAERYGVQYRPRQSMFVDRFAALKNYLTRVNSVLSQYPISENRLFNILNSSEPVPPANSGEWNLRVANLEILGFQNLYLVPIGYKYLVSTDSNNSGRWTIYTVVESETQPGVPVLVLTKVQNYNTPDFWSYIDWYRVGYNSSSKIVVEVPTYSSLSTLSVAVGSSVKVTANAQGKWEIYLLEDSGWSRVGLQDGTIEFSNKLWDYAAGRFGFDVEVFDAQYFDQEPVIETRKIIQAINEELLVDTLAIERNRALVLMFNFILSEFSAPEWLIKTSLVDVDHRIRDLVPYQNYIRDNQEFVEEYIQEVKPYHVKIREFNLKYSGIDQYSGSLTDFDLPAYYNTSLEIPQFTSPILLPYNHGTAFNSEPNTLSDLPSTSSVWQSWPYSQWYNNFGMSIESIDVVDSGSGFTEPPIVQIKGNALRPAAAEAIINSLGQLVDVIVTDPGEGYVATPEIILDGGNGVNARVYPRLSNDLVRSFRTVIRYDRFQYVSNVTDWNPSSSYPNGTLVRYNNQVWQASSGDSNVEVVGPTFNLEDWTLVDPETYTYPGSNYQTGLTGVDRTMGLYVPGVNQPGVELPLLIDGIDYPGVQVYGNYFLGIEPNDVEYSSEFTNVALGTLPTDVNVDGGKFIGVFEGHAPEELVNGAEYDTLDFRVFTRPGADWDRNGHGFEFKSVRYQYQPSITNIYSWENVVEHPIEIVVNNVTKGLMLTDNINYTTQWGNQTITIINGVDANDIIDIAAYELGGGSQLYRANYSGAEVGQTVVIPVNAAEIWDVAVFVDGTIVDTISFEAYTESVSWSIFSSYSKFDVVNNGGLYYRALQDVPAGIELTDVVYWLQFVPTLETLVDFGTTVASTAGIALVAMGFTSPEQYSWSTPQIQTFVADVSLSATKILRLDNSLQGTNSANLIVTRNSLRLRPADGIEWFGDDSSVSFGLPQRSGYSQSLIDAPNDVSVWVDNVLQQQSFGSTVGTYVVTNWNGSNTPGRQVVFDTPPAAGSRILISVDTGADYNVTSSTIELATVNVGDVFNVITWNDTAQQALLTQVFQGPVVNGITIQETYDSTPFDLATVSDTPGSFDYTQGAIVVSNDFYLGREDIDSQRLWVTLDGYRLFEGQDYVVQNGYLILSSGTIKSPQILVVTEFTESLVPEQIGFRIFQDMRGVQGTYRITPETTTTLSQPLASDDDIIYVNNARAMAEPDLDLGIFGVITINGERIMYRERDLVANTLSGLRRGTLGTAAAAHQVGNFVYDMGQGNLLNQEYQDYIVSNTSLGDGSTTLFTAPSITIDAVNDSSIQKLAIEVYVGGIRQYEYSDTSAESQYRWFITNYSPVAIEFVVDSGVNPVLTAPPSGVEVTILVRRGVTWYAPGINTPSNGQPLQDTNTVAARFLRGK